MRNHICLNLTALIVAAGIILTCSNPAAAASGQDTFKQNCASCHADGGNIVNKKKPLKGSSTLASLDTFKQYLLKPTAPMIAYPKIANDPETLQALYTYCKTFK